LIFEMPAPVGVGAHALDALPADLRREHRPEPVPPIADRLVAHVDAALREQVFDVPKRERVRFRLQSIEALLSAKFIDISMRSAEVKYLEPPDGDPDEFSEYRYYGRPAELRFWSIDPEKDQASSVSAFAWATDAGVLPRDLAGKTADQASSPTS
jgi:hypothetical protein